MLLGGEGSGEEVGKRERFNKLATSCIFLALLSFWKESPC